MNKAIESVLGSVQGFLEDNFGDRNFIAEERLRDMITSVSGHADIAMPCHQIASELTIKNPVEAAEWLRQEIKVDPNIIARYESKGPFINFFVNRERLAEEVLSEIHERGSDYGKSDKGEGKTVVFDYSAPNIGKPLHIGHIRSTIIGDAAIRILQKAGYSTHGINYLGDIGLHLGKIIYSYQRYLDPENLEKDPERELLRLYVKFGEDHEKYVQDNKSLEQKIAESPEDEEVEDVEKIDSPVMREAKAILKRIEGKDPEMLALVDKIHDYSMRSFDEVYGLLGVGFDEITGQSRFSERGKREVQRALDMGVAEVDERGAVVVKALERYGIPPKVILRSDGTAIYSTQDLGAANERFDRFHFDRLVYVVAEEQKTYFEQMFKILELMGNSWADRCHHLSFGMINLADEKMSSRKGNIVYLADVLRKSVDLSRGLIKDEDIGEEEREEIARKVGIGAIKYMVLGVDPIKPIQFTWKRALDLSTNSSPYVQYSYVRANSLTRDRTAETFRAPELTGNDEFDLIKKLSEYQSCVERAAESLRPNMIANYAYDLAKSFTRFYHSNKIIGSEKEESRLFLVGCYKTVLQDSLSLLGIGMPERM